MAKKRWRKIGGGSFRLRSGRIIKPNQEFVAEESQIPEAFKDLVVEVEPTEQEQPTVRRTTPPSPDTAPEKPEPEAEEEKGYSMVEVEGEEGQYNIIGPSGKVMNDKPLTKEEAEEVLKALEEE